MKYWKFTLTAAALLVLSVPTFATSTPGPDSVVKNSIWLGSSGNLSNWRAISRDELIIWATPFKPYLVKIWRPFRSLRFVQTIGVTSTTGRVTTLDSVIVDGQRLPIKTIVALDREAAKSLKWNSE